MSSLLDVHSQDIHFTPIGALCGFIGFQTFAGGLLARNIYKAFAGEHNFGFSASARTVGLAHALNYIIQLLTVVLVGGYGPGTVEAVMHESKGGDVAIVTTMAACWLWFKVFADSAWLTRALVYVLDQSQRLLST